jgi:hypothetical protein
MSAESHCTRNLITAGRREAAATDRKHDTYQRCASYWSASPRPRALVFHETGLVIWDLRFSRTWLWRIPVDIYWRFGRTYRLHIQGRRVSNPEDGVSNSSKTSVKIYKTIRQDSPLDYVSWVMSVLSRVRRREKETKRFCCGYTPACPGF